MPRYVILYHQRSNTERDLTHWDLMLESEGILRTWQIHRQPIAGEPLVATALADHRLEYLQYEGPISENRGYVSQWDGGTFEGSLPADNDPFSVHLEGRVFKGRLLVQPHPAQQEQWQVQFSELVGGVDQPLKEC